MFLAGMDVSGRTDNYQYLGIVIGETNNVSSLYRKIGAPTTHMSGLPPQTQRRIISELQFDHHNRIAICVKIDRKKIIDEVKQRRIAKYQRMSTGKLFAMFEQILFKYLKHEIEKFTLVHHLSANAIPVECDDDSQVFVKAWGTKSINPNNFHFIADAIAWCNTKEIKLDSVIELDYTKIIKNEMIHKLQK